MGSLWILITLRARAHQACKNTYQAVLQLEDVHIYPEASVVCRPSFPHDKVDKDAGRVLNLGRNSGSEQ